MKSLNGMISQLNFLNTAIEAVLETTVADEVRQVVAEAAQDVVYSYEPAFNSRRKENGGLSDPVNMEFSVSDMTLVGVNVTPLQNLWGGSDTSPLAPIVCDGEKAYHMPYPRDFMAEAQNRLDSGRAAAALKRGLALRGINLLG